MNQLIECSAHPGKQYGYVVCRHVVQGSDVAQHIAPKIDELGEILCAECVLLMDAGEMRTMFDNVTMICAPCAMSRFAGRLPI